MQAVEGWVLTPLIQRKAVDLQPAVTLAAQMLFGAVFGALGIALAIPVMAVVHVAVMQLYVEDGLGE